MLKKVLVEDVSKRLSETATPVLLKFQNGNLVTVNKQTTQFSRTKRKDEDKALVVTNGSIYHGDIKSNTASNDGVTDSYICVRNRATNKMRIIAIDESVLNNYIHNTFKQKTMEISKNELIKKFGGRKAMRYINDSEKSKINVDMVKDNLDKMVEDADVMDVSADQDLNGVEHFLRIRPNFNPNANTLSDIYNLYDVVPKHLLDRMDEEAKAISITPVDQLPISSDFLRECLSNFQKEIPSNERELKIKLILYMDCLLNLLKSRKRTLGSVELSAITEKVENDVRERFCDSTIKKFMKTPISTEKAFCYFLVLALLINDKYEVDINLLKTELCSPRAKIIKYANIINARVKYNSDTLKLCLPSKMKPLPTKSFRRSKQ